MMVAEDREVFAKLVPPIKKVEPLPGSFDLFRVSKWHCAGSQRLVESIHSLIDTGSLRLWRHSCDASDAEIKFFVVPGHGVDQSYTIAIEKNGVRVSAAAEAGLYHAAQTLAQLAALSRKPLPCCRLYDQPDFIVRGVMLDISRDKVPTLTTLFKLVDSFARLKINHLQLYTEHTFAYKGHEPVWQNASPLTPEDVRQLDRYCAGHFIELVPNQNSFGHLERWLSMPPYNDLAVLPEGGAPLPWGGVQSAPTTLNPIDPRVLELLNDLYSQLLPNFRSELFNVGCDEVFGLARGRCADEVRRIGEGRVYLNFLKEIFALVERHRRRPAFWGDIIIKYPELVAELPKNALALEWGYEADHPFDQHGRLFHESGLDFYVCPGTSSWNSIAGRHTNMLNNIQSAATSGVRYKARGMLLTDWGDCGHWQPLCVSYPAFVFGAVRAWCSDGSRMADIADATDRVFIGSECYGVGRILIELADLYRECGALCPNASVLFHLLFRKGYHPPDGVNGHRLLSIEQHLDEVEKKLRNVSFADGADSNMVQREIIQIIRLLRAACLRGRALVGADRARLLYESRWPVMRDEIAAAQREVWLARNRPQALETSLARLVHD